MSLRTTNCRSADQRRLHRRDVDFAVALAGVAVADVEQRALRPDRDVERRSGDQLLVVEIPGVNARRRAVHSAHRRRRRDADAAEERMQRNGDAGAEMAEHVDRVELDDLRVRLAREILRA